MFPLPPLRWLGILPFVSPPEAGFPLFRRQPHRHLQGTTSPQPKAAPPRIPRLHHLYSQSKTTSPAKVVP